jgi:hypothetical protein
MLFKEISAVYSKNHINHTNAHRMKSTDVSLMLKKVVYIVTTVL